MREVKFQYIWTHGHSIAVANYTLEDIEKGTAKPPRSRNGSIMQDWECVARRQSTCLKDKDGKEIYSGDIVNIFYVRDGFNHDLSTASRQI